MDQPGQTTATTSNQNTPQAVRGNSITPELVAKVADKVFEMLRKDLQIEMERYRVLSKDWNIKTGGR
ncbi:MAG TPA: hypothetical protein VIO61_08245 [Anaerolineaceae bacterium]